MEIFAAIERRNSVRAYLDRTIPKEVISKILEVSSRSPSATNIQPWNIYVVSGAVLDNLKRDNVAMFLSGAKTTEEEPPVQGIFRQRRIELAKDLFKLLEIEREDKEKRTEWVVRGYRYYDAPTAIVLTIDKEIFMGTWALLSIGALMQNICLVALEYGLGTCISEQGVAYHDILKKYLDIPDEERIIISISLGYPDHDFLPNQYTSKRASLDETTRWVGF